MDSVKLSMILFATGYVLSMCMALNCNWKTEYEYSGKCCHVCPSGEFPTQHCKDSSQTVCKKCTGISDHCFCNNSLCQNDKCTECSPSPHCKQGEQFQRTGYFKFAYQCIPSLTQTDKDEVDKMPKTILTTPELPVIHPQNRAHNATYDCQVWSGMVECLALSGLICLSMLIYVCIQRTREQKRKKKYPLTSSSLKASSDECVCKLSKEEMGEV